MWPNTIGGCKGPVYTRSLLKLFSNRIRIQF